MANPTDLIPQGMMMMQGNLVPNPLFAAQNGGVAAAMPTEMAPVVPTVRIQEIPPAPEYKPGTEIVLLDLNRKLPVGFQNGAVERIRVLPGAQQSKAAEFAAEKMVVAPMGVNVLSCFWPNSGARAATSDLAAAQTSDLARRRYTWKLIPWSMVAFAEPKIAPKTEEKKAEAKQ